MQPVPHDKILSVELEAQEWNAVISLLSEVQAPYRVIAPLISKLQMQLVTQAQDTSNVSSQDER